MRSSLINNKNDLEKHEKVELERMKNDKKDSVYQSKMIMKESRYTGIL